MNSIINSLLIDIGCLEDNRKRLDTNTVALAFCLLKLGVLTEEDYDYLSNWIHGHIPQKRCPIAPKLRAMKKAMKVPYYIHPSIKTRLRKDK